MANDPLYIDADSTNLPEFDAIVIGSGISGGWAAKELTEKGLKVLMLERGGDFRHIRDYKTIDKPLWEFKHRGKVTNEAKEMSPIANHGWIGHESIQDSWVNEKESPYTQVKPFKWWRSYRLGGRSTLWSRQVYRWSDTGFEANAKEGIGIDWPIRYKDIEPWYTYVEKHAGISGSVENIPHLPDGHFLPPMELNHLEKHMKKQVESKFDDGRKLIIGRTANITKPIKGRLNCQYRNRCWEGCNFGAYFSTQSSTLPAAVATGNLSIRVNSIVTQILYDKDSQKATGVEILDATNNKTYTFNAKIIFLNASTLNSAWVLMNSATDVWEDGLGSSSGELGHNIMDHHYNLNVYGEYDGFLDKQVFGKRPNGFYIPRFVNLNGDKRSYLRGFGYQGRSIREPWSRGNGMVGIGGDFKDGLAKPGIWSLNVTGFGEVLPYHENRIYLDKNNTDKWGLNTLAMDCELKENEMAMRKDMISEGIAMFEATGLTNVRSREAPHHLGHGVHEMGTARMGHDPKTSVLNSQNQVWDAKNVFVTDGACMVSSDCINPSLTYMALTARAADYAVSELKKMNL